MSVSEDLVYTIKEQLSTFPIFQGTQGFQLESIIRASMLVNYKPNDIIFKDGERAHGFFCILRGVVKIHARQIKFIELGSGKYFGEYSMIEKRPHSATATAMNHCQCLVLPPDVFNNLLQQSLPFSNKLLQSLINRLRSKDELEISLLEKNREISEQNNKISEQNKKIREQHDHIRESMEYAGMIQSTLLPSKALLDMKLNNYFLIFHPREEVSGDFYWFAQRQNKYFIAIADCTGHGVPGSMLSILGVSFLNELITQVEIPDPGRILSKLNNKMQNALSQNGERYQSHDGIDISLVMIDFDLLSVSFAGANSPLYLIRDDELTVFEPNKVNVGTAPNNFKFTVQDLQIDYGDMIYMFTDGIVDQLGGTLYKRFTISQLRKILMAVSGSCVEKQEQAVLDFYHEWKGDNFQTDDVTLFGLRV